MRFEVLGPLVVVDDGGPVRLRPALRRLLTSMLISPGVAVPLDVLVDRMWGESAPATARNTLHVHMSNLRRQAPGIIASTGDSYMADLDGHEFDVTEFTEMATEAAARLSEGKFREASDLASRASGLWRGDPFPELLDVESARGERHRLVEILTLAVTTHAKALTLQGRVSESIGLLRQLVVDQPFNESFWEELILAYYLAGRQADALNAFREASKTLGEGLGVEPGPRLRELEDRILIQDAGLLVTERVEVPNNLPGLYSSFVGRDDDIKEVRDLIRENHLVTVTGAPGIGKTRLAIEVGVRALGDFQGGVWLVRLSGCSSRSDVAASVAAATQDQERGTDDLVELFRHLGGRPALLILDNCEHVLDPVREFLSGRTHGDRLVVLATSRTRLGIDGEVVRTVRELELPTSSEDLWDSESARLLADRLTAADSTMKVSDLDPDQILEICRKTGGVPLALELTARWMPSLDLATIASLTLTQPPVVVDAEEPHHGSVSEAIAWSIALLAEDRQSAFDMASVFTAPFTAEAFAAVCSQRAGDNLPASVIGDLVEASLLVPEHSDGLVRYRMLEPLRDFGAIRLTNRARRTALDRHARFFVATARGVLSQNLGSGEAEALDYVQRSISDFRRAMRHLLDTGRHSEAAEIAVALVQYWVSRLLSWEGQRWLMECLDSDSIENRARVLCAAGEVAYFAESYEESQVLYKDAHELARQTGDRVAEGKALFGMARLLLNRNELEGYDLMIRALEPFEESGHFVEAAYCRVSIGIRLAYSGDTILASDHLQKGLGLLTAEGYLPGMANCHCFLALAAWHDSDEDTARAHIDAAIDLIETVDDPRIRASVLATKAMIEGEWGDLSAAATDSLEALGLVGATRKTQFARITIGTIPALARVGEWALAARVLSHFRQCFLEIGWAPFDEGSGRVPRYRLVVEAGLADCGEETDPGPILTEDLAEELIDRLNRIKSTVAAL